jgi:hypothetical protein
MEGEPAANCVEGQDAELVACDRAWELNEKAGRLALAAKGDSSGERKGHDLVIWQSAGF